MRLFFALLPDAPTRERLVVAAAQFRLAGPARTVAPPNLHITLAFIGEVPFPDLDIYRAMGLLSLRRFIFDLDLLQYWPKSQAVVLVARQNLPELAAQADRLRAVVTQVRPRRDDKPWRAHATLARKVAQAPVLTEISPVIWVSHSFCLMSSRTDGDEPVYTVVDSWPLLDKP